MTYNVTEIPDGWIIEDRDYGHRLAIVRFTFELTEEQELKLVNEFKELIIKRMNLSDKESNKVI